MCIFSANADSTISNHIASDSSDGRYYRHGIEITDTYESIDTFDTRKKYR